MERVALSRWPSRRMRFASRASRAALSGFAADQVPDAVSHRDGQRAEEELPQARAQHRTPGQPRPERELLAQSRADANPPDGGGRTHL
jgi:hypothetical protein